MPHYKRVEGDKVYLSPISTDDIDTFMNWVNDPEIIRFTGHYIKIISLLNEKEAIEKIAKEGNYFSIVAQEDNKLLGICNFFRIDEINRSAEIGIMIGEKDNLGKGYGSEALNLLLKFGFESRNYNNISLRVMSFNERAIACYEKVGFKRQGLYREAIIRGNKKYDMIYMDILADEYFDKS